MWHASSGALILSYNVHAGNTPYRVRLDQPLAIGRVTAAFSPDGSRVVVAGDNKGTVVWDARTGAEIFTLNERDNIVSRTSFSPDGTRMISTGAKGTATVWDIRTGAQS